MEFLIISEKEFREFSENRSDCSFWQSAGMNKYKESQGCTLHFTAVKENDQIIAGCAVIGYPTVAKMVIYHALRGFVIDYENEELVHFFLTHLKEYLKSQKGVYLHFNPYVWYQKRDRDGNEIEGEPKNDKLIELLKKEGCTHAGFIRGFDNTTEPRWMVVMDLEGKDEKTLLKEMDQQTRWSVNRSLKYPIHEIECTTPDEIEIYAELMDQTAKRRGFESYPHSYYSDLLKYLGNDRVKIRLAQLNVADYIESLKKELMTYEAEKVEIHQKLAEVPNSKKFLKKLKVVDEGIELTEKKVLEAHELRNAHGDVLNLAGSVFIWDKDEVIYLLSASDDTFRKIYAPYTIQWNEIRAALKAGKKKYNFYGTSGIFDESADDYGVFEFKRGFNSYVVELVGDFDLVLDSKRYHMYSGMKKIQSVIKR